MPYFYPDIDFWRVAAPGFLHGKGAEVAAKGYEDLCSKKEEQKSDEHKNCVPSPITLKSEGKEKGAYQRMISRAKGDE